MTYTPPEATKTSISGVLPALSCVPETAPPSTTADPPPTPVPPAPPAPPAPLDTDPLPAVETLGVVVDDAVVH